MLSIHSVNKMCPKCYLSHLLITPRNLYCCQSINLLSKQVKSKKAERNLYTIHNLHISWLMFWKSNAKDLLGLVFPWWAWAWTHTLGLRLSAVAGLRSHWDLRSMNQRSRAGLGMQLLRILRARSVSANGRRASRSLTNHSDILSSSLQVKEGRKWEDLIAFQHSSQV